ncbi:MAG TPA: alpha/beta fold hydrolase, partial [Bryobacteraceae bacterium]
MQRIERDGVRGWLELPAGKSSGSAMVLTHGAGANAESALLKAISAKLCDSGWTVLRCDLPFRQRHAGPPRPPEGAGDREGLRQALALLRGEVGRDAKLFLAGQSYGGRQATMLVAEDPAIDAAGLMLTSYPLHPPGKPEKPRTAHLPQIHKPAFFAQGSRDSFATRGEMEEALKMIPAPTQLFIVEGAGHD